MKSREGRGKAGIEKGPRFHAPAAAVMIGASALVVVDAPLWVLLRGSLPAPMFGQSCLKMSNILCKACRRSRAFPFRLSACPSVKT